MYIVDERGWATPICQAMIKRMRTITLVRSYFYRPGTEAIHLNMPSHYCWSACGSLYIKPQSWPPPKRRRGLPERMQCSASSEVKQNVHENYLLYTVHILLVVHINPQFFERKMWDFVENCCIIIVRIHYYTVTIVFVLLYYTCRIEKWNLLWSVIIVLIKPLKPLNTDNSGERRLANSRTTTVTLHACYWTLVDLHGKDMGKMPQEEVYYAIYSSGGSRERSQGTCHGSPPFSLAIMVLVYSYQLAIYQLLATLSWILICGFAK